MQKEKLIEQVIQETGISREVAVRLLAKIEPTIAEDVLKEPSCHLLADRVKEIVLRPSTLKDGQKAVNQTFVLSCGKRVGVFHRTEIAPDDSGLVGKRVFFVLTKERVNPFSEEIEFSGRVANIQEIREMLFNGEETMSPTTPTLPNPAPPVTASTIHSIKTTTTTIPKVVPATKPG